MSAKKSIGGNVYKGDDGAFYVRPWINGKRTWRKLTAMTERYALKEAREKLVAQERSKQGTDRDPFKAGDTFSQMADLYLAAKCPNRRLEPRPEKFCQREAKRIQSLKLYFGVMELHKIKLVTLPAYKSWRISQLIRNVDGERTVEMDLCTLSNVLNYAVLTGHLDFNYIRSGRPKFQPSEKVQHCRQFAPTSADEIHKLADLFFDKPSTEVMGWLTLFIPMTGCRISEMLGLRWDAATVDDPGYIEGNCLFIRRSKHGLNPYIVITAEFQSMLECFRNWHIERWPNGHPFYFPGKIEGERVKDDSFSHALPRAAAELGMSHRTPHGLRSFYVTKRRSDGLSDSQIAAEIGDATPSLIAKTYGNVPPNWLGQKKLGFLPSEWLPAWERWRPMAEKVVSLSR